MQAARKTGQRKTQKQASGRRLAVVAAQTKKKPQAKRRQAYSSAASFHKVMACVLVLSAFAMVNLSQRVLIAQNGLAISDLQRRIQAARTEKQQLEMALLVLESPGRIQSQAMGKLRMIQPSEVSYVQARLPKGEKTAPAELASKSQGGEQEGILGTVLEKVAGQVQLLPLGNIGTPIE